MFNKSKLEWFDTSSCLNVCFFAIWWFAACLIFLYALNVLSMISYFTKCCGPNTAWLVAQLTQYRGHTASLCSVVLDFTVYARYANPMLGQLMGNSALIGKPILVQLPVGRIATGSEFCACQSRINEYWSFN